MLNYLPVRLDIPDLADYPARLFMVYIEFVNHVDFTPISDNEPRLRVQSL